MKYSTNEEFNKKLVEELKGRTVSLEVDADDLTVLYPHDIGVEVVIVADDLDKLSNKAFLNFIENVIDPLNIGLFLTTAQMSHIENIEIATKMNKIFDYLTLIEPIDTSEKLKTFVDGRINAYSKGKPKIAIKDQFLDVILDRTRGNLRESFRILSKFIEGKITEENLIETIRDVDLWRISSLDETTAKIFEALLKEGMGDADTLAKTLEEEINLNTIKSKLNELVQLGLIFKISGGRGRGKKVVYEVPDILREIVGR